MVNDILTPMNHREIDYYAGKLSGCDIPDSSLCEQADAVLKWLEETGKLVFDEDLVMDYGTDCLRLYLLFENTPKANDAPYYDSWQEGALEGLYKFLGRYRRLVLTACEWNERGNYTADMLNADMFVKLDQALCEANAKIDKCILRGNTMPNRHNIVAALMELVKTFQKELKIGEIVTALRDHAIETAVPHGEKTVKATHNSATNPEVTKRCQRLIILMAPFVPDLSKVLWNMIENK